MKLKLMMLLSQWIRNRDCESIRVGGALASTFGAKAPSTPNETMAYRSLKYYVSYFQEYFHSL